MKRTLEITFMDGTKALHMAEHWDNFKSRAEGMVQVEYKGQAFAWYPIRNIKSIIAMEIEEEDRYESEKRGEESGDLEGTQGRQDAEGDR